MTCFKADSIQPAHEGYKERRENWQQDQPSPNVEWLKTNRSDYAGMHVALKNGELIATGRTTREAHQAAREKGVADPLLHYTPAIGEEIWGGW